MINCMICSISSLAANTYAYMGEFHSNKTRAKQLSYAGVFIAVALAFCPGLKIEISLYLLKKALNFSGLAWLLMSLNNNNPTSISFITFSFQFPLWRFYLLLCSTLSLASFVLLSMLPESPKFLLGNFKLLT